MPDEMNEKYDCFCQWYRMNRPDAIAHMREMHGGSYAYKDVASFEVALPTLLVPPIRLTRSEMLDLVLD
jgi:hypothetical protein